MASVATFWLAGSWLLVAVGTPSIIAASSAATAAVLTLAAENEPGQRLTLAGRVVDETGRPIAGAELHVYHTDTRGNYTPDKPMDEPHARLAGRVRSDAQGCFELRTIRPGGYAQSVRLGDRDRKIPAHIHIDVSAPGRKVRRLQAVFAEDPLLADLYWRDWVKQHDHPVLIVRQQGATQTAVIELVLRPAAP